MTIFSILRLALEKKFYFPDSSYIRLLSMGSFPVTTNMLAPSHGTWALILRSTPFPHLLPPSLLPFLPPSTVSDHLY